MPPTSETSTAFLPYGRQQIDEDDIAAVMEALRSDWLTTGPKVGGFEAAVCEFSGAQYGVAVSSGTAALHAAMHALGIGPGDEVIVPAMTFAATANCVVYQGGTPVFADVDPDTLLIDPADVALKITPRTRAIIAVDYAGQPCDYDALRDLARVHGLALVADGCHSLGGSYRGRRVGTLADLTVFSFHPVKHITTGEGGMVVTDNRELAARMRRFRNHGIDTDHRQRETVGTWAYQMVELGYNYRLTDLQAALGTSQLAKLPGWLEKRRKLAAAYDTDLANVTAVRPLAVRSGDEHAYHLYVVRLADSGVRGRIFAGLRQQGIGANVHYLPVHLHPYYQDAFHTAPGLCPTAEAAYDCILTLPLHQGMEETDVVRVVHVLRQELGA
ncbi:MAG: UDP-4-amino-4,6-dideoxy-N-acetyl-beta-L-altrosamine transaminase [Desulfobulbaceae bacterium]|nr:UDP-4-amino-4,6-dideoxy-N-acetyl-beta-L-altrosamine transaminase [Desulfobulbaceae bacterium]HIJ90251.1 UDP-4-amino-4,6-dideoxy-N-acetyl-beta-L-altrosamine transaminase [Deltaproteobacteria bacterium]